MIIIEIKHLELDNINPISILQNRFEVATAAWITALNRNTITGLGVGRSVWTPETMLVMTVRWPGNMERHGPPSVSSSLSSVFSLITSQSDAGIIGNKVMELWLLSYLVLSLITNLVR